MIKNILIKGELEGRGIVNFDSAGQRYLLATHGIATGLKENVKLGKKAFIKTGKVSENGNEIYDYKSKISADCIRHAIFEHDVDVVNGVVSQCPSIFATYLLSPVGVMRGYMFPCKDGAALKRKSPLTVTDAIQCNDAKSNIEACSTTGDRSDTSFFFAEKSGDMKYSFTGQIDVKQLQFISADPFFDRMAINSDWIDKGEVDFALESHYGGKYGTKYGVFTSMANFTGHACAENGVLLDNAICEYIIKKTLKDMLSINIVRNNAFAATSSLKIKLVDNILGVGQKMNDEEGWIELNSEADVDALDLSDLHPFFTESSEDEIKKRDAARKKYEEIEEKRSKDKEVENEVKKQRKQVKK